MALSPDQLHMVLELLDRQFLIFVASTIGSEGLTDQDKQLLKTYNVHYESLYDESKDLVKLNFQLGMLSNILSEAAQKSLTGDQLIAYIKSGNYIPLNQRELATINSLKMQSLADIRSIKGRIFNDVNSVVGNAYSSKRANDEEYLRSQVVQGTIDRKTRKQIAKDIAKATGDWSRNFNKSVAYISHLALNEGRVAMMERRAADSNKPARGYFIVQKDACKYCVDAYLKNGPGSEPKIFTVSEIQANGSNIGRKVAELKPTFIMHPNCRCLFTEYIEGTVWDGSKFVYLRNKPLESGLKRPKIRVSIAGEEYWV